MACCWVCVIDTAVERHPAEVIRSLVVWQVPFIFDLMMDGDSLSGELLLRYAHSLANMRKQNS